MNYASVLRVLGASLLCGVWLPQVQAAAKATDCDQDKDHEAVWGAFYAGPKCLFRVNEEVHYRYHFEARAGQKAIFGWSTLDGLRGGSQDLCILVKDPNGVATTTRPVCTSRGSEREETFQLAGTYTVDVFLEKPSQHIDMLFDFSSVSFPPSVPSPIIPAIYQDEATIGRLESPGELDVYALPGLVGDSIEVEISRSRLSIGSYMLELLDPTGAVTLNGQGGCNSNLSTLVETLPESGVYTLKVRSCRWAGKLDYTLALSCLSGTCVARPQAAIVALSVNGHDENALLRKVQRMKVSLLLKPRHDEGKRVELWLGAYTPFGTYWYTPSGWVLEHSRPVRYGAGALGELDILMLDTALPEGAYHFFGLLDPRVNGKLDVVDDAIRDGVQVMVRGD